MSSRVLVVLQEPGPLGPAAGWRLAIDQVLHPELDLHVAICKPGSTEPDFADLPGTHHFPASERGDRLWPLELRRLVLRLKPDLVHCLAPSRSVRWGLTGTGARQLVTPWVNQMSGVIPDTAPGPGDWLVSGQDSLPATLDPCRVIRYQPGWPANQLASPAIAQQRDAWRASICRRWEIPHDAVLIVAVEPLRAAGRLKNLIWALDLLCCIRDDVHLVVLGSGPHRQRFERFGRTTEAFSHLHFAGEPDDSFSIVSAADVFWTASGHEAAWLAVSRAMADSVPVVAAADQRLAGLARHFQTALLVRPDSRDGFARWTKYLLEQTAARETLVKQAQRWSQQPSLTGNLGSELARLYLRPGEAQ